MSEANFYGLLKVYTTLNFSPLYDVIKKVSFWRCKIYGSKRKIHSSGVECFSCLFLPMFGASLQVGKSLLQMVLCKSYNSQNRYLKNEPTSTFPSSRSVHWAFFTVQRRSRSYYYIAIFANTSSPADKKYGLTLRTN